MKIFIRKTLKDDLVSPDIKKDKLFYPNKILDFTKVNLKNTLNEGTMTKIDSQRTFS